MITVILETLYGTAVMVGLMATTYAGGVLTMWLIDRRRS
jgi:hypothetical protein